MKTKNNNRSRALAAATTTVALAPGALAGGLYINNWCSVGVSIVQSHNAGCDYGVDGTCIDQGGSPWYMEPGTGQSLLWLDFIRDGIGTSIKISKDDVADGVLQYEYSVVEGTYGGLYWDLSDLDGSGAGLVGTPFHDQNVKVSPTGNGANTGTCVQIRCEANTTCYDSYQHPDDPNTKWCPADTGDMYLDLCQPYDLFITKRDVQEGDQPEAAATAAAVAANVAAAGIDDERLAASSPKASSAEHKRRRHAHGHAHSHARSFQA